MEDIEGTKVEGEEVTQGEGTQPEADLTQKGEETPEVKQPDDSQKLIYEELERNYKNLQRKYNKIYDEVRQRPQPSPQQGDDKILELLIQSRKKADEYSDQDPVIAQLETELAARKEKNRRAEMQAYAEQIKIQERGKLEDKITSLGLDPESEDFDDVWESFDHTFYTDGKFDRVDRKLERMLKNIKVTTPKKEDNLTETPEQMEARIRKQILKEQGMTNTETGLPSGGSMSDTDFIVAFSEGKLPVNKANVDRINRINKA